MIRVLELIDNFENTHILSIRIGKTFETECKTAHMLHNKFLWAEVISNSGLIQNLHHKSIGTN